MMCIDKSDVHMIVEKHLEKYQGALEKYLGLKFDATNDKIQLVIDTVDKINGRVHKAERHVRDLQDLRLHRELDCPFRKDIESLNKRVIENGSIEAFISESDDRREKLEAKRNRILLGSIAIISMLVTIMTLIINYMVFNQ